MHVYRLRGDAFLCLFYSSLSLSLSLSLSSRSVYSVRSGRVCVFDKNEQNSGSSFQAARSRDTGFRRVAVAPAFFRRAL